MAIQSKLFDILPENYGYVLLAGVDSIFVNMWMAMKVGNARKKFGVKVLCNDINCVYLNPVV